MLLLTQGGEIINLDRMAIIDAANLNVYARQGMGERGIVLGSYNTASRYYEIIGNIFNCHRMNAKAYSMPEE